MSDMNEGGPPARDARSDATHAWHPLGLPRVDSGRSPVTTPGKITLAIHVNGIAREALVWPMARLLDVIREDLELTGTKEGCGEGECGACSVFLNGRLVNSCLVPAVQCQGAKLETIEGVAPTLADGTQLHPVQDAFLRCGGAQCGICTPGMVMAALDLLKRCPDPDEAEVRDGLSGNLCRCTGYVKIVDSVMAAAKAVAP